ncbi:MAG TPA: hypothetical protein VI544_00400 [Candidatus Nanoarchaeia archaeon]|nr:hypothetical protein [Candidatus Nanoarchaeia archaeon]
MKISKIIVEGPDCSGKSTLVERLKNKLKWDSKSLHHKEGNQFQRYLHEYAFADNVVFDRSHISEEVYGTLWRGGSSFMKSEKEILDCLIKYNSIIIFACPPLDVMKERYKLKGFEQQISIEELEKSRELFLLRLINIPHLLYASRDYSELNALLQKVVEMIK